MCLYPKGTGLTLSVITTSEQWRTPNVQAPSSKNLSIWSANFACVQSSLLTGDCLTLVITDPHLRRMQSYEGVHRPERKKMTAGKSVVEDTIAPDEDTMVAHLRKQLSFVCRRQSRYRIAIPYEIILISLTWRRRSRCRIKK